ncbi:MAG: CHAT domain-containing tetratricopeptide repeat protein [Saprospiraceae bacterium]
MHRLFIVLLSMNCIAGRLICQDSTAIVTEIDSLINLNRQYISKAKFDEGLTAIQLAENKAASFFGKNHIRYARCLFFHGRALYLNGKLKEAEKYYLEAKSIYETTRKNDQPDYAWVLNNLGGLYWQIANYAESEKYYLEAISTRKRILGVQHPDYAWSLHNLAILYVDMGFYEKAEPLYLHAKEIRKINPGVESNDYAYSLNHLALLYDKLGNIELAEDYHLQAKEIFQKVRGTDHPDYAWCLGNLSQLYQEMGNYEKAEKYALEVISIREKVLGKNHADYASAISGLASIYLDKSEFEKAESLFIQACQLKENIYGKQHEEYAKSIVNLATYYQNVGDFSKSNSLLIESKTIRQKLFGTEHLSYAESLLLLANNTFETNHLQEAKSYYVSAKNIFYKLFGEKNINYMACLEGLTNINIKRNKLPDAISLIRSSREIQKSLILNASRHLSEQELSFYIQQYEYKQNIVFSLAQHSDSISDLAYNNTLFYKGFLMNSAIQIKHLVNLDSTTSIINNELKSFDRRLAKEYSKPSNERNSVSELEDHINTLEKDLTKKVTNLKELKSQITWKQVQEKLKSNEAVIEFIDYNYSFPEQTDSIYYAALLIKPEFKKPKFILLCKGDELDSILQSKGARRLEYINDLYTFKNRGAVPIEHKKRNLAELIYLPLQNELENINTIYYSNSGLLHRINLNAIPISESETIADKYQLIELNSSRQLAIPNISINKNNDAILFGGINYDSDSSLNNAQSMIASRAHQELTFQQKEPNSRGASWEYLPGTEREVTAIDKILNTNGVNTHLLKSYQATEEYFKSIGIDNNPSPKILHIATHGFFFSDPKGSRQSSVVSHQEEPVFKMSEHPMLRSGLLLSQGNEGWNGDRASVEGEDGVLTAYEISQMNLSNTELVVLSACETGLGDIQGNEGVYGLQRAFKIAGVKYLIMSLWQVPDKQTSLLMISFYKKWLENKMSIPDAFHAAQKELRDIGLDPYQWAGFVLIE